MNLFLKNFRKASFVGDFNEDQQRSENIRYFFPDGCKGSDIVIPPGVNIPMTLPPPKVFVNSGEPVSPPKVPVVPQIPKLQTDLVPPTFVPPPVVVPVVPVAQPKPPVTPKPVVTTPIPSPPITPPKKVETPATPQPTPPSTRSPQVTPTLPSMQLITKIPAPPRPVDNSFISKVVPPPKDACRNTCCSDDDTAAKLVIPIPLKNVGKSGSCEKIAKLIIPVDGLNPDSLRSLTKGSDTSELIKTVLQSLA